MQRPCGIVWRDLVPPASCEAGHSCVLDPAVHHPEVHRCACAALFEYPSWCRYTHLVVQRDYHRVQRTIREIGVPARQVLTSNWDNLEQRMRGMRLPWQIAVVGISREDPVLRWVFETRQPTPVAKAPVDIISAIDSATGCHQCGNPLDSSPSSDFCSEFCQGTWQANRVSPLPLSKRHELPIHTAPSHTVVTVTSPASAYGFGGARWLAMRRDAENYPLAHFEWSPDGGLVDNMAAIQAREGQTNADRL